MIYKIASMVLLLGLIAGSVSAAGLQGSDVYPQLLPNFGAMVVDARTEHAFVVAYRVNAGGGATQIAMFNAKTGGLLNITPVGPAGDLAVDEQVGHLLVAGSRSNTDSTGTITIINTQADTVVRVVPLSTYEDGIFVHARTHRAYVLNEDQGSASVLDDQTGRLLGTIPTGTDPVLPAFDDLHDHIFSAALSRLTMLDAATGMVLRIVAIPIFPLGLAVDDRAGHVVVVSPGRATPHGYPLSPGTVTLVDTATGGIVRSVSIDKGPRSLVVDAATSRAFVLSTYSTDDPGANPNATHSSLTVLDTRTGALLRTVSLPGNPFMLGLDRRLSRVFVLNQGSYLPPKTCPPNCAWRPAPNADFLVVDAHDGTILRTVPVGGAASTLAVDELHSQLLVLRQDGHLSVFDAAHF